MKSANFFSILFDGATDNATKDQEGFYVLLFDPHPMEKGKRGKVEVQLYFLGIKNSNSVARLPQVLNMESINVSKMLG